MFKSSADSARGSSTAIAATVLAKAGAVARTAVRQFPLLLGAALLSHSAPAFGQSNPGLTVSGTIDEVKIQEGHTPTEQTYEVDFSTSPEGHEADYEWKVTLTEDQKKKMSIDKETGADLEKFKLTAKPGEDGTTPPLCGEVTVELICKADSKAEDSETVDLSENGCQDCQSGGEGGGSDNEGGGGPNGNGQGGDGSGDSRAGTRPQRERSTPGGQGGNSPGAGSFRAGAGRGRGGEAFGMLGFDFAGIDSLGSGGSVGVSPANMSQLRYWVPAGGTRGTSGGVEYVGTTTAFVTVSDLGVDGEGYRVRFYTPRDGGGAAFDSTNMPDSGDSAQMTSALRVVQLVDDAGDGTRVVRILPENDSGAVISSGAPSREFRYRDSGFYTFGGSEVKEIVLREAESEADLNNDILLTQTTTVTDDLGAGKHAVTVKKEEWAGGMRRLVSIVRHTYEKFYFGERLVEKRVYLDEQMTASEVTAYAYVTAGMFIGRLKEVDYPDGNWRRYDYALNKTTVYSPLENATPAASGTGRRSVEYDTSWGGGYDVRTVERVNGQITAVRYVKRTESAVSNTLTSTFTEWTKLSAGYGLASPGSSERLVTTVVSDTSARGAWGTGSAAAGRTLSISRPDGTLATFAYDWDTVDGKTCLKETMREGAGGSGGSVTDGIQRVTWINEEGFTVGYLETDISSSLVLRNLTAAAYTATGQVTEMLDNATNQSWRASYSCCGLEWSVDYDGTAFACLRDLYGRVVEFQRGYEGAVGGVSGSFDPFGPIDAVTEHWQHTVGPMTGRRYASVKKSTGAEADISMSRSWNLRGELASETDGLGNATTYTTIQTVSSGPKRYRALPQSGTAQRYRVARDMDYRSGRTYLKAVYAADGVSADLAQNDGGGNLEVRYFRYGSYASGEDAGEWVIESWKTWVDPASLPTTGTRWVKTYYDLAGRVIKREYPEGDGTAALASETMAYSGSSGQLIRSTDADGVATLYSYNAKGEREMTVVDLNGNAAVDTSIDRVIKETRSYVSDASHGVLHSTTREARYGVSSGNYWFTLSVEKSAVTGLFRSVTRDSRTSTREVYSSTGTALVPPNSVNTVPGAYFVKSLEHEGHGTLEEYAAGRLDKRSALDSSGATVSYTDLTAYDGHGRVSKSVDSRTGETAFEYDKLHRLVKRTDPGSRVTEHAYDALGNETLRTLPDSSTQSFDYYATGQVVKEYGSQKYQVAYGYDLTGGGGQMTSMETWRDLSGSADATSWSYDPARGWLAEKTYPDTKKTSYTYTKGGRLASRTWHRVIAGTATKVRADYGYDAAGDLLHVDYNDSTPDVLFARDRLGQPTVVKDGTLAAGAISSPRYTYTYTYAATYPPRLEEEKLETSHAGFSATPKKLDRLYTAANRYNGYSSWQGTNLRGFSTYDFDAAGRLAEIRDGDHTGTEPFTFTYEANSTSNRLEKVSTTKFERAWDWETTRDALTEVVNKQKAAWPNTTISDFDYATDSLGRRTDMDYTGTAFSAASGYNYLYNGQGELAVANSTAAATDANRAYVYDGIGNRHWESQGNADLGAVPGVNDKPQTGATDYTADQLNQYAAITGMSPSYDDDGNLLGDGDFVYEWDAENRLVEVEPDTAASGDRRLRFEYDYLGRRVSWILEDANTGALESHLLMIWDGWNLVTSYLDDATETDAWHCTWTWGPDISGSMQGAGGVGGLLSQHKRLGSGNYPAYACYDGNGNIWQYVKKSDGSVVAAFEYDAFGNVIASSGADKDEFRFRFSTKWQESDALDASAALALNWNYYGYRYYDAETGRWPSRDPIGERGGVNLYGFVGNAPLSSIDILGLNRTCPGEVSFGHWTSSGGGGIDEDYDDRYKRRYDDDLTNNPPPTCYVGCGANKLNEDAGNNGFGVTSYPRNNYPSSGVWPERLSPNAPDGPISDVDNNDYNPNADPEAIDDLNKDIDAAADAVAKEICTDKCCKSYKITLKCAVPGIHEKCGKVIKEGSCDE